jgi:ribosomal protein S27E
MYQLPLMEKILFLESNLGDKWTYPILEPYKFDSSDAIKVQEAAKYIANHLRLPPLTFIISYTQQKLNVGGHINIDSNKDVFIEIDSYYKRDCDIVLALLAHEICHKFLQINNLRDFRELENEMLTDAATIFTGLGKLSLNGCEKSDGSTTVKIGYMNSQEFAFVFRLVCEMRRIPESAMLQGLSKEAANQVVNASYNNSYCFNEIFFSNDFILKKISEAMKNEIGDSQKKVAKLNRNIRVIQESVLPSANNQYKEFHSFIKLSTEKLTSVANKSFNKEEHNYLKNLVNFEELELLKRKIIEKDNEIENIGIALSGFVKVIRIHFPKLYPTQNLEFLFQFECPSCNNRMRIGEKKLIKVKCPRCGYSFIIDTGEEETKKIEPEINGAIKQKQYRLWTKVKSLFSKERKKIDYDIKFI